MKYLIPNIKKTYGWLMPVFGVTLTVLTWIFKPEMKIPLYAFIIICSISIWAILLLAISFYDALKDSSSIAVPTRFLNDDNEEIFLLEPNDSFSMNALIAVYLVRDDCERLLGYGNVINIQANRKIQIKIIRKTEGYRDVWDSIRNQDILNSLIVKTNIPISILHGSFS